MPVSARRTSTMHLRQSGQAEQGETRETVQQSQELTDLMRLHLRSTAPDEPRYSTRWAAAAAAVSS
jgi:hypothetical protein